MFGSGPPDGVQDKIILYADCTVWRYLILKKDLHPIYTRWYLFLHKFNNEVRDKGEPGAVTPTSSLAVPLL